MPAHQYFSFDRWFSIQNGKGSWLAEKCWYSRMRIQVTYEINHSIYLTLLFIMSFFSCTGKTKKKHQKFALVDLFRGKTTLKVDNQQLENEQMNRFVAQLAQENVSYKAIQELAWNGVPHCLRPKIWKYLLRYALIHATEDTLNKKRTEYQSLVTNYWKPAKFSDEENKVYHTIEGDVKRIGGEFNSILKSQQLQIMLKRLLYVWHMRHPASGYVQGMCDLINPFVIVFLSEYLPLDCQKGEFQASLKVLEADTLQAIEADTYWCMSKMLEYVTKNYTTGFGGLHQAYSKVQELLYSIDEELYQHLMKEKIDLFSLSFRAISTMMLRMFEPLVGIRLFDTFISYEDEYPTFMIYLLIAILQKFANNILALKSDELMTFIQKIPTKQWSTQQLQIVIAEAYVYKKIYSQKSE